VATRCPRGVAPRGHNDDAHSRLVQAAPLAAMGLIGRSRADLRSRLSAGNLVEEAENRADSPVRIDHGDVGADDVRLGALRP
jgi:hypothetical protein